MEAARMTDAIRTKVTVTVNGRAVDAAPGELLIEVAERAGTFVPRFCYHPRMEPVGVCRMCLVEVDGPRGATLQPACYIKVSDGMNVITDSEKVKKAQDGVLEFLLANHPLDCPVCDKGGECPLQDQTLSHGSGETRFIEEKRHFVKPIEIGANVLLDRERCIQCSRCTRFAADVAGDPQIAFAGRGDLIEVATSPSEPFDSIFSGNTVQICPVGALTTKPYRFSARPWDLEQVESTCTTCAVGCRIAVQSSGDRLSRVLGVDAEGVNQGWLCDKGRFSLDSVDGNPDSSSPLSRATRITQPMVRVGGVLTPTSWDEALQRAAALLTEHGGDAVGAIGGASLTNEAAFAWERFVRGVLGSDHLDAQFDDGLDPVLIQALPAATIDDAAKARVVVTITGDLREELPVLFLRLRENVVRHHRSLVEFRTGPSALTAVATHSLATRPGEVALVAKALIEGVAPKGMLLNDATMTQARALLGDGSGVVFVVGRPNMAESSVFVEEAIGLLVAGFPKARFLPALRRSNVRGALDMGLSPQLRPGRVRSPQRGRDTIAQLEALRDGTQKSLLLLGGDLLGNMADGGALAQSALSVGVSVVAVTGHGSATLAYADVVLPALVAHERSGTVTNIEGRVTAVTPKISGPGSAWSDVAIAAELAEACGQNLGCLSIAQVAQTIEETLGYPALSVLQDQHFDGVVIGGSVTPTRRGTMDPMAFPGIRSTRTNRAAATSGSVDMIDADALGVTNALSWSDVTIPSVTSPLADAYALRVVLARRLYDQGVAMGGSPALRPLVEVPVLRVRRADLDRLSFADGDNVIVTGSKGSFAGTVCADEDVVPGTLVLGFATGAQSVQQYLLDSGKGISDVRLASQ